MLKDFENIYKSAICILKINCLLWFRKEMSSMLNQLALVGRLVRNLEIKEGESGKKYANITLAVPRSFKNINGEYETDFIDCTLWDVLAKNTMDYCKKGDLLAIRGRLQSSVYEKDDKKYHMLNVIAEKVTFLNSKKTEE